MAVQSYLAIKHRAHQRQYYQRKIGGALFIQDTTSPAGHQVLVRVHTFEPFADPLTECAGRRGARDRAHGHWPRAEMSRELGGGEDDFVVYIAAQQLSASGDPWLANDSVEDFECFEAIGMGAR